MRVVFFGSSDFALPVLQAICESHHDVEAVVTQPPRPAGRGGHVRPTVVQTHAQQAGLECIACPDVNDPAVVEQVARLKSDVLCVVEFGQKILEPMRKTAPLEAFNLHASLLPALRGAAPINWAIIRGHAETGVTTFRLVDRMDAGPVFLRRQTPIDPSETAGDLKARLAKLGAALTLETLGQLSAGWISPEPQDEARSTRAPRLSKSDGHLEWDQDARALCCRIHGTNPWPGAQGLYVPRQGKSRRVTIARAQVTDGQSHDRPGTLGDDLGVQTGQGRLRILEIKPAGKKLMAWADFVNGYRAAPGDRFDSVKAAL
jgi:methionyl-tRNA formyltransferase